MDGRKTYNLQQRRIKALSRTVTRWLLKAP